jgi:hypothetical protein
MKFIRSDIQRTFYSTIEDIQSFQVHKSIHRMPHMLCCQTSLNKFKNIEIIITFYDHSDVKLEISKRRAFGKFTDK